MKNKEAKKLTITELHNSIERLKKDLFNLRFQKSNGQLTSPSKFKIVKKDISRILTQINSKKKQNKND